MIQCHAVSKDVYHKLLPKAAHAYNSTAFHQRHQHLAEEVIYLVFEDADSKVVGGIIMGKKKDALLSPYSAPFGGFTFLKVPSTSLLQDCIQALRLFAKSQSISIINITLPPSIYSTSHSSMIKEALTYNGFQITYTDINHSFSLNSFQHYLKKVAKGVRKNILKGVRNPNLSFYKCISQQDCYQAYQIIQENRKQNDYPLRLSWEALCNSSEVIPMDCFLVYYESIPIAAAIIFQVTSQIAQVIYWGDLKEYRHLYTMNYLSYQLFEYYQDKITILDIGPSSEHGIPDEGLCTFKERIGCDATEKWTLNILV
ncbi:hypothetical protein GCM10023331_11800 [Algivirga pacifica]|uniref:BioF2-like acetyltransferase domain-containing protein n=2 Tax=Algivirga pacifica TaxID=1162670 RepID=A0ABP9D8B2_9BACT